MKLHTGLLLALLLAGTTSAALTGCGDEDDVVDTVMRYQEAIGRHDGRAACELKTRAARVDVERLTRDEARMYFAAAPRTCAGAFSEQRSEPQSQEVESVKISDDHATVHLKNVNPAIGDDLFLRHVDGRWLVDREKPYEGLEQNVKLDEGCRFTPPLGPLLDRVVLEDTQDRTPWIEAYGGENGACSALVHIGDLLLSFRLQAGFVDYWQRDGPTVVESDTAQRTRNATLVDGAIADFGADRGWVASRHAIENDRCQRLQVDQGDGVSISDYRISVNSGTCDAARDAIYLFDHERYRNPDFNRYVGAPDSSGQPLVLGSVACEYSHGDSEIGEGDCEGSGLSLHFTTDELPGEAASKLVPPSPSPSPPPSQTTTNDGMHECGSFMARGTSFTAGGENLDCATIKRYARAYVRDGSLPAGWDERRDCAVSRPSCTRDGQTFYAR